MGMPTIRPAAEVGIASILRLQAEWQSTGSTYGFAPDDKAALQLAIEHYSLERFVTGEPLYRVHECVFGALALESEPVDPRL